MPASPDSTIEARPGLKMSGAETAEKGKHVVVEVISDLM